MAEKQRDTFTIPHNVAQKFFFFFLHLWQIHVDRNFINGVIENDQLLEDFTVVV